jgi:hypothetical protein
MHRPPQQAQPLIPLFLFPTKASMARFRGNSAINLPVGEKLNDEREAAVIRPQ